MSIAWDTIGQEFCPGRVLSKTLYVQKSVKEMMQMIQLGLSADAAISEVFLALVHSVPKSFQTKHFVWGVTRGIYVLIFLTHDENSPCTIFYGFLENLGASYLSNTHLSFTTTFYKPLYTYTYIQSLENIENYNILTLFNKSLSI